MVAVVGEGDMVTEEVVVVVDITVVAHHPPMADIEIAEVLHRRDRDSTGLVAVVATTILLLLHWHGNEVVLAEVQGDTMAIERGGDHAVVALTIGGEGNSGIDLNKREFPIHFALPRDTRVISFETEETLVILIY